MHHGCAARMAVATPRAAASAPSSGDALQGAEDLGSVRERHTASSAPMRFLDVTIHPFPHVLHIIW